MKVNIVRAKYALRKKAREWNKAHPKDTIEIPKVGWRVHKWGDKARILAYRYSKKKWPGDPSAQLDLRLVNHLFPNLRKPLKLIKVKLNWRGSFTPRVGPPEAIVWHHAAAKRCSIQTIHSWHLGNGWLGCAYMFVVSKKGKIYVGRPEDVLGGHTYQHPRTIGVCFEGNFDAERMSDKQMRAGQELHAYLHKKYGAKDKKHSDFNPTGCPGRYFPFEKIVSAK